MTPESDASADSGVTSEPETERAAASANRRRVVLRGGRYVEVSSSPQRETRRQATTPAS